MLHLRAHHLLCLQGFQGHGYNDEFTANMLRIAGSLGENPRQTVCLIDHCDDLCAPCKNNRHGTCTKAAEILAMDQAVLNALQLASGAQAPVSELFSQANERLANPQKAREICGDCHWSELCLWRQSICHG